MTTPKVYEKDWEKYEVWIKREGETFKVIGLPCLVWRIIK